MAVISLTIEESAFQKVAGIPYSISITTNVPATIFYTLDNTEPTLSSSVFIDSIVLPDNLTSVTLKTFATDGTDTSAVVTKIYRTFLTGRNARDKITGLNDVTIGATYPFGSQDPGGPAIFGNMAGQIVDSPDIVGIFDGYDGTATGTPSNETDVPIDDLDLVFSETDSIGQRGRGIGTLPANVVAVLPPPIQENSIPSSGSSDANSPFFNPKALVIFQDNREEPFDPERVVINRQFFSTADSERTRNGRHFFTTGEEGNIAYGTMLKPQYNPREGTVTYYYRDSETNRWIISKVAFTPKTPNLFNYSTIVFGRDSATGKVFKWIPFKYRQLT